MKPDGCSHLVHFGQNISPSSLVAFINNYSHSQSVQFGPDEIGDILGVLVPCDEDTLIVAANHFVHGFN